MDIQQSLTAIFEPVEDGGYIAYVVEIEGAHAQGETLEEAKTNLLEALDIILDVRRELAQCSQTQLIPSSRKKTIGCMKLVDFVLHLDNNHCFLLREETNHNVYVNTHNHKMVTVSCQKEIKNALVKKICEELDIQMP